MENYRLKTPIAFLIFNRPDTTAKVFERIRQVKPPILLVVADAPRFGYSNEAEKCAAARAVINNIDWECQVIRNYADTNMGCKKRISSGLNWVFQIVEEAIILEDDCLPHPSFFRFCEEILNCYRHDTRIMAVSGNNFQFGRKRTDDSYYFSRYSHCWGWATWKRAWKHYDVNMKLWLQIRENQWLNDVLQDKSSVKSWEKILQLVYENKIDTWDYQWTFACWLQNGLTVLPNVNLVSNIGFSEGATHTKRKHKLANLPVAAVDFPLQHPPFIIRDSLADSFTQRGVYTPSLANRIIGKLQNFMEDNQ